jgi:uncharacterized protein (TIGR03086 family)
MVGAMATATDPLILLSRALDQAGGVVAAIGDGELTLPTPCRSWDVGTLTAHLIHDLEQFRVQASGGRPAWGAPPPGLPPERAAAFDEGARALLDAWRESGDLGRTVPIPGMGEVPARFFVDQEITELAIHAWDLAVATRQPVAALDPVIAEAALVWSTAALRPEYRGDEASGRGFGPEVPVPPGAPAYDRLAGWLGRSPA